MALEAAEARIKGKIWQAIAQSGVSLATVSPDDVNKLVAAVTDAAMGEVDDILTEASGTASTATPAPLPATAEDEGEHTEETLWEGRPFLSISTTYTITTERIRIVRGLLNKERDDIELVRVQEIDQKQGLGERMVNVGDIIITAHDTNHPKIVLENVANVLEVHEILRKATLAARKRHNFNYREQM